MKATLPACVMAACLVVGIVGKTAVASAEADGGFLDVSSDPSGAKIFIDDADMGQTTPQHHLAVKAGHHQLTLVTTDGAHKLTMGFSVERGQTKKLTLYLAK